jgi:heavy metal sensor kinase
VLWFTAVLALVLAAFSAFVYYNQSQAIRGDARFQMERRMDLVPHSLPGGKVPSHLLGDDDIFLLLGSDGSVIASQGTESEEEGLDIAQSAEPNTTEHFDSREGPATSWVAERGESETHYIFVARPVTIDGEPAAAILGSPFDPYGLYERLLLTLLGGSLLTLAVALAGGLWLADRAMRPVHAITQAAREISETDLSRRLNLTSRDELGELARTFDAMLDRLEAAFARQRQFVADASHELRTPLTIVNLEADRALAGRRTPQDYQQALATIRSENLFMTSLVNDLLALARMDSGQQLTRKESLDLSELAIDAVDRLLGLAERSGVRLETGVLPAAPIQGDRQMLLQMVSNLVENGIKYAGGAGQLVRVETGADAGFVWLRVTDNGPGIAAEHLAHLFDRFYQVDKARTRGETSASGSGLGLSIVQSIARLHGGEVRVESAPGEGAAFQVRFPARPASEP